MNNVEKNKRKKRNYFNTNYDSNINNGVLIYVQNSSSESSSKSKSNT